MSSSVAQCVHGTSLLLRSIESGRAQVKRVSYDRADDPQPLRDPRRHLESMHSQRLAGHWCQPAQNLTGTMLYN